MTDECSNPPSPPGDSDAAHARTAEFVRLFTKHSRRVYTYILTLLPNRVDAEDVFQDVSVILWEKFSEFEPGTQFGAWACKIAYFRVLKHYERQRLGPQSLDAAFYAALTAEIAAADDTLDAEYRALADCFAKLSPPDRQLIEDRYRPNGSPQRLAASLGQPIQRIYKTLARLRRTLLECVLQTLAEGGG